MHGALLFACRGSKATNLFGVERTGGRFEECL